MISRAKVVRLPPSEEIMTRMIRSNSTQHKKKKLIAEFYKATSKFATSDHKRSHLNLWRVLFERDYNTFGPTSDEQQCLLSCTLCETAHLSYTTSDHACMANANHFAIPF